MPRRQLDEEAINPFREWSLDFYARPGVENRLLDLQDRLGLDVNLLLFACWVGATGQGRLPHERWVRLIAGTREWRCTVVEPLRAVRRYLKGMDDAAAFREKLKALELEAEFFEQATITAIEQPLEASVAELEARTADVVANLQAYVAAAGPAPAPTVEEALRALAGPACGAS